jgi:hypothetical protein
VNDSADPTFYLLRELAQAKEDLRRERRKTSKARARALRWKKEARDWQWQALGQSRRVA